MNISFMKIVFLVLSLFPVYLFSQGNQIEKHSFNGNSYFKITEKQNDKLLIFLHGGVNNPNFKDNPEIKLEYLIENNLTFIEQSKKNGFDFIAPIVNDSINWLKKPLKAFEIIQQIIKSQDKKYNNIILSGHSDGGTGSFKIFYSKPNYFDGLVLFNGYPQHQNFFKKANYSNISDKKIVFYSTLKDQTIPYEFSLTEYCNQKKFNPNTFLFITEGDHSFSNYNQSNFIQLFDILLKKIKNATIETNPIHGFTKNDQLIEFYPYRKMIVRKFAFGADFLKENKRQKQSLK